MPAQWRFALGAFVAVDKNTQRGRDTDYAVVAAVEETETESKAKLAICRTKEVAVSIGKYVTAIEAATEPEINAGEYDLLLADTDRVRNILESVGKGSTPSLTSKWVGLFVPGHVPDAMPPGPDASVEQEAEFGGKIFDVEQLPVVIDGMALGTYTGEVEVVGVTTTYVELHFVSGEYGECRVRVQHGYARRCLAKPKLTPLVVANAALRGGVAFKVIKALPLSGAGAADARSKPPFLFLGRSPGPINGHRVPDPTSAGATPRLCEVARQSHGRGL